MTFKRRNGGRNTNSFAAPTVANAALRLELQKLLGYSVSDDNVLNVATLAQQLFNLETCQFSEFSFDQTWQCTPGQEVAWNLLLSTTSAMLCLEMSLLGLLLQENYVYSVLRNVHAFGKTN